MLVTDLLGVPTPIMEYKLKIRGQHGKIKLRVEFSMEMGSKFYGATKKGIEQTIEFKTIDCPMFLYSREEKIGYAKIISLPPASRAHLDRAPRTPS